MKENDGHINNYKELRVGSFLENREKRRESLWYVVKKRLDFCEYENCFFFIIIIFNYRKYLSVVRESLFFLYMYKYT